MNSPAPPIQIENLSYAYGRAEAVHDLSLTVQPGRCYGLFGRNGAGKTTTMKCLLNLLRPQRGHVRVFGLDPAKHEVEVKRLLSYVPDQVAFYPWMSVRETLDYLASFRSNWNRKV
jgi:ABC-type multidrug transport system ATPase subunit